MNRRLTRASLMSDTKWRKLFLALGRAALDIDQIVIKFVDVPDEKVCSLRRIGLHPPHAYFDSEFGPTAFRAIEWLLIPRKASFQFDRTIPAHTVEQRVDEAADVVAALGRYPTELTERGLVVTGHLPVSAL